MKWLLVFFANLALIIRVLALDGPEDVSENVNVIFTRNIKEVIYMPLSDLQYLMTHKSFNMSLPTAVYVHGWLESGLFDLSTTAVRGAYLDRGDHNVVTIDWSHYSKDVDYFKVIPQLKVIAETIAESILMLVKNGCDIKKLHLVGHSLGGQMVGKIGRHMKELSNGKVIISKIFALDPAGPGFEKDPIKGFEAITKSDGAYVQIIHTNGGFLGMERRVGNADFYPNGGVKHPGCDVDAVSRVIALASNPCNHFRSWHFYQLSVRNETAFPAVRCDSWDDFVNKKACFYDDIEYMGFGASGNTTGKYFLQTHSNIFNLTRGMDGIHFYNVTPLRLLPPISGFTELDDHVPVKILNNVYF